MEGSGSVQNNDGSGKPNIRMRIQNTASVTYHILFCLQTLLPQYLAMYRLTVDNQETYMVVTRNVFSGFLKIHRKYDLKGR
jgi:hypothetical protein